MKTPSQADRLLELLSDGKPHRVDEILRKVYQLSGEEKGIARIASRVTDLRNRGYTIDSAPGRNNPKLWWYILRNPPVKPPKVVYELEWKEGRPVRVPKLVEA